MHHIFLLIFEILVYTNGVTTPTKDRSIEHTRLIIRNIYKYLLESSHVMIHYVTLARVKWGSLRTNLTIQTIHFVCLDV